MLRFKDTNTKLEEDELSLAAARVRKMEEHFDGLLETAQLRLQNLEEDPNFRILTEYYESGLWLKDYELDEKGLLPKELKRGVLSQDGLYNLLCERGKGDE